MQARCLSIVDRYTLHPGRRVRAIEESVGPMLLGIVEAKRVLELCCGRDELAKIESV